MARGYGLSAAAQDTVKLTVLTHWNTAEQKDPLEAIFKQYTDANPNVEIELQTVPFADLLTRITTGALGGETTDIVHIYNLWLPDLATSILAAPPEAVITDVTAAYAGGTVAGASYGDQVWGFPTEVNTYQLIYNKKMLDAAGVTRAHEALRNAGCRQGLHDHGWRHPDPGRLYLPGHLGFRRGASVFLAALLE